MKRAILFLAVLLCSCAEQGVDEKPTNNPNFRIALLFEYDGCKVYRFMDAGHWVYFTKCQGASNTTSWEERQGKTSYPMMVSNEDQR